MDEKLRCELVSWAQFYSLCRRLAIRIHESRFRPDLIVAIARGGYMPARVLSDFFGIMDLGCFRIEHYRGAHKQAVTRIKYPLAADVSGRRVLLVDDVSDSGDTFEVAIAHLRERGTPTELRTAVMHHKVVSRFVPDYYAAKVLKWRWLVYPWAVMEDLGAFIESMEPRPTESQAVADRLHRDHGIRVSSRVVLDALASLERQRR